MNDQDTWRASRRKRLMVRVIEAGVYPFVALVGSTLRWKIEGLDHFERIVAAGRQPVMAFWHGRIMPATYFFRKRGIVVITSENFDGEWIARVIRRFGYGTARGSTTRGARRALLQLKRDMEAGRAAGFTVDGPRGPAHKAQPGAVWLAKVTGNPMLPFHMEASRHWTAQSWDRTQVPKPFSLVAVAIGEPIAVAPDADEAGIEAKRQELEDALNRLHERASGMLQA